MQTLFCIVWFSLCAYITFPAEKHLYLLTNWLLMIHGKYLCQFAMLILNEQHIYICIVLIYAVCLIPQQLRYIPPIIYIFVFYRVTSIWENSLQITTVSSFLGTWLGAFPIPLDWGRPWQVGFNSLKQQSRWLYSDGKTDEANEYVYLNCFIVQLSRDANSLCYCNLGDLLGPVSVPQASRSACFYLLTLFFSTCIGE